MARTSHEDTSWVSTSLPTWQNAIYTVDNTSAPLHTAMNKGNEVNVYLTYLTSNCKDDSTLSCLLVCSTSWNLGAISIAQISTQGTTRSSIPRDTFPL